jgi:hypothetical protein
MAQKANTAQGQREKTANWLKPRRFLDANPYLRVALID